MSGTKITQVASIAYGDNALTEKRLEALDFVSNLIFDFNGNLTVSGGTTDGALVEDGLLRAVLKEIAVTADGKDQHVLSDGIGEYYRRAVMSGSPGVLRSPAVGVGTNPCRVNVTVDFDAIVSAARFMGRINARALTDFVLRLRNGIDTTDLITGGDRTNVLSGTVDVFAEWHERAEDWFGGARYVEKKRFTLTSSETKAELNLPLNRWISQVLLVAVDDSARDDDLILSSKIRLDLREDFREQTWEAAQSLNVEDYGLETDANGEPPFAGIALLDFDRERDMDPKKLLNTFGRKQEGAKLEFASGSPTGTAYLDAYFYSIDPAGVGVRRPRPAPAARAKLNAARGVA
jgi:hypothetical protein